jgi:hypothetical protein
MESASITELLARWGEGRRDALAVDPTAALRAD